MFEFLQAVAMAVVAVVAVVVVLWRHPTIAVFKVIKDFIYFLSYCGVVDFSLCAIVPDLVLERLLFGLFKWVNNKFLFYVTFFMAVVLIDVIVVDVVVIIVVVAVIGVTVVVIMVRVRVIRGVIGSR